MYKKLRHTERPFVVHLFIGVSHLEIPKKLNRIKSKLAYFEPDYFQLDINTTGACTFDLEETLPGHFCLYFPIKPDAGTIAHEVFHAVVRHFRYIGVDLTESNEETYAYSIDWIVTEIHKMIKKL